MNTFIISSKDLNLAIDRAISESNENKIDILDRQILEFEKALGIDEVRKIQKRIFFKPFKSKKKAILIVMHQGATTQAQNSMLKLLEEPPTNTLIFLITDNHLSYLPTVLSRTKTIEIKEEMNKTTSGELGKILGLDEIGERLYLAQIVSKEKTETINWLEKAILAGREMMIKNLENKQKALMLRKIIHQLELTHYDLKTTNSNPRLALENLFLNL